MDGGQTAGLAAGHGDKRAPDGRRLSAADDEWASLAYKLDDDRSNASAFAILKAIHPRTGRRRRR